MSPSASREEVQRAYEAQLAESGADDQRRDVLTAARDALLAASAWQAPGAPVPPIQPPPQQGGIPPQPPSVPPQQGSVPPQPPSVPPQQGSVPPSPPSALPLQPPYTPPAAPPPGYAQQSPYPPAGVGQGGPNPGPWYPPAPSRRGLSTGAIIGITLGSAAVLLVVLLVAVISIISIGHSSSRLAETGSSSSAAPFGDPSDEPSDGPLDGGAGGAVDDYDVDGVHVHYVDGWTFELTSAQACVGATVTVGFADTTDGGTMDVWSTVVDLPAGEPYELTVPHDASDYVYAGIDSVDCTQT